MKTTPLHTRFAAGVSVLFLALAVFPRSAAGQAGPANIGLNQLQQLSLEELMQTTVTSVSRLPEKLLDTASAIQVVSGDDIRRSGVPTIAEALRLADNLEVAQKDPHDWAISARGFNSNLGDKLLVMIDGRTVYTPLFSGVLWNAQDYLLEDIDRIEVISGPGGTLWGANAVNGVINISTKSAEDTQGVYLETGGGTELREFAGARYGGSLAPEVFFRVYAKAADFDNARLPNGSAASDAWKQGQGGFRLDAGKSSDDLLTVQGDYYSGNELLQGLGLARIAGGNVLGNWTHTFADGSDLSVKVYFDRTHLSDPFGASPFAPAGLLIDDLDTYDFDLQHSFSLGRTQQVVWGFGYRHTHDDVRQEAPNFAFEPPRLDQDLFSIFGQDEIRLRQDVTGTIGTKLEHNDYTGLEWEPSARLRWHFAPDQSLWAAVSRAVRMPSRLDRDLAEPAPPSTLIRGGADFISETVVAYEVGYRAQLGPRFSTSLSTFYNVYDHLRSLGITPVTTLPLTYGNDLVARTYGAELSANYQLRKWWRLHLGYDLLKEHVWIKAGKVDFEHALDETADPKEQWALRSSMDLPHNVQFDLNGRWVGELPNNNGGQPGMVPSYFELGGRLAWNPTKRLELSLVGENLLHSSHPEFGPDTAAREQVERTVFGKVACRF